MQIDSGWAAIVITILISLLGLATGLGALWQRVNGHDKEFKSIAAIVETNRRENKDEHRAIMDKIDQLLNK